MFCKNYNICNLPEEPKKRLLNYEQPSGGHRKKFGLNLLV